MKNKKPYFLIFLFIFLISINVSQAHASKHVTKIINKKPSKTTEKVLFSTWYTIQIAGMPYAYYQDQAEDRGDKIHYQNHLFKLEEGYLNEEHLGGLALKDGFLTPLFFNFRANYRSSEVEVNGNIKDGVAHITISKGTTSLPIIKKSIPKGTILSVFFPLLIKEKLKIFKPNQFETIKAIHEDSQDGQFDIYFGRLRLDPPDDFSKKNNATKIILDYRDLKTIWYFDSEGMPIRIESPARQMLTERTTELKAKNFLRESNK